VVGRLLGDYYEVSLVFNFTAASSS
jgi:hypothetical protein